MEDHLFQSRPIEVARIAMQPSSQVLQACQLSFAQRRMRTSGSKRYSRSSRQPPMAQAHMPKVGVSFSKVQITTIRLYMRYRVGKIPHVPASGLGSSGLRPSTF